MKLCMTSAMTASLYILLKKVCALHVTLAKAAIAVKEETTVTQDQTLATVATAHVRVAIAAKVVIHAKVVLQVRVVVLVGALTVLVNRAMATIVPLLVLVVTFVVHLLVTAIKTNKERMI